MKVALVFILCLVAISFAEEENPDFKYADHVAVLTDGNLQKVLEKYEFVLVKFFAPWCGHCKKIAPEYAKAAEYFTNAKGPVLLAEMDATENKESSDKYEIKGFPTIKFFTNFGKSQIDYSGGRTEKEIITWVTKKSGELSKELKTMEEFEQFMKNRVSIIYFGHSVDDAQFKIFKNIAISEDNINFGHVFNQDISKSQKVSLEGAIVLYKQFDELRNDFSGDIKEKELKEFITKNSYPLVMEFDDRAIERIFHQAVPTIFLFVNNNDESKTASEEFKLAAKALKGKGVQFCLTSPDDGHGHYQRLADFVGINVALAPQALLIKSGENIGKYKFS